VRNVVVGISLGTEDVEWGADRFDLQVAVGTVSRLNFTGQVLLIKAEIVAINHVVNMIEAGTLASVSNETINYCILDLLVAEICFNEALKPQLRDVDACDSGVKDRVNFISSSSDGLFRVEAPGVRTSLELAESNTTADSRPEHISVGLDCSRDTTVLSDIWSTIVNP